MSDLLTIDEAAALLRVSPSTIRSWRQERKHLRFVKVRRLVRVPRGDIESYIERGAARAAEPPRAKGAAQ